MSKFRNKYRIESTRLQNWDYAANGAYFITVCTDNREHFLGECNDGKMTLSTAGAIVQGFWYEIPKHFPFVELGEFVVMPNHIHGIIIIDNGDNNDNAHVETGQCPVSTTNDQNIIDDHKTIGQKRHRNQGKNTVSSIIGSYKSICTKHIHKAFPEMNFEWQERFWDNIIRNQEGFDRISNYILNNPKNWKDDRFYGDENDDK